LIAGYLDLGCCRFQRHLVKVEDETGGGSWEREGSSVESSKLEAVKLVKERGVAVAQAARELDVHENVLRKWIRDAAVDPQHVFPGQGVMRPEQAELERLRKENAKLRMERDLLKKAAAYFAKESM
jgi:transposase